MLEGNHVKRLIVACFSALLLCSACNILNEECWDDYDGYDGASCE